MIDNLLVRIHLVIEMIWWTDLAPWEFDFRHLVELVIQHGWKSFVHYKSKFLVTTTSRQLTFDEIYGRIFLRTQLCGGEEASLSLN